MKQIEATTNDLIFEFDGMRYQILDEAHGNPKIVRLAGGSTPFVAFVSQYNVDNHHEKAEILRYEAMVADRVGDLVERAMHVLAAHLDA